MGNISAPAKIPLNHCEYARHIIDVHPPQCPNSWRAPPAHVGSADIWLTGADAGGVYAGGAGIGMVYAAVSEQPAVECPIECYDSAERRSPRRPRAGCFRSTRRPRHRLPVQRACQCTVYRRRRGRAHRRCHWRGGATAVIFGVFPSVFLFRALLLPRSPVSLNT